MNHLDEALLKACKNNGTGEAEILCQKGANVNCKGVFESPLLNAVRNGDAQTIKVLIDAGAKVNSRDFGTTPLIEAILFGRQTEINGNVKKSIIKLDFYEVLVTLLENGANLKLEDDDGKSALYHLAQSGLIDELSGLLKAKGKINEGDILEILNKVHDDKAFLIKTDYSLLER